MLSWPSAALLAALAACAAPSELTEPPQPSVGFPELADMADWTVTAEDARAIALGLMERDVDRYLRVNTTPLIRGGQAVWRVTGTNLIAGHWEVEIDPRNGMLVSARRFPGR